MEEKSLLQDDQGLTTVEYIIILTLVVIAALAAWQNVGQSLEFQARTSTGALNTLGTSSGS